MPKIKFTHRTLKGIDGPEKRTAFFDTETKGLALRVTVAGTKTFFFRYRFDGRNRRYTIGRFPAVSLKEARKRVRKLKVQVNDGIDPQVVKDRKKHSPDAMSFRELTEEYKSRHLQTLREATREEYERIIDVELVPKLKGLNVSEIKEYHIRKILEDKAHGTEKQKPAPTMANRIRSVLSSIYNFAIKKAGLKLQGNPVQATTPYKTGENKRERVYSEKEIRELWSFFVEFDEPIPSVLKMLLITGQRKTETMRMRWDDISLEKNYKRTKLNDDEKEVTETYSVNVWTIPAEDAKNKRAHEVPLSDMALEIIEQRRPESGDSDYIFESPVKENEPIEWVKTAVKVIKDHSKVPDFRLHDLRRTAATYMAESGVNPMVIGKVLNHKGLARENTITARYNRHDYMEKKRQALNRWSYRLQQILDGKDRAKITKIG